MSPPRPLQPLDPRAVLSGFALGSAYKPLDYAYKPLGYAYKPLGYAYKPLDYAYNPSTLARSSAAPSVRRPPSEASIAKRRMHIAQCAGSSAKPFAARSASEIA